ncbi:MAG: hypothetical protein HUU57_05140 [Bdellovibrio sp.]|nr:hypothetical protein [Bdellovibrio sp.]
MHFLGRHKGPVNFTLVAAIVASSPGCGLVANIASLNSVEINGHEIFETSPTSVIVKLDGKCPDKATALDVSIDGKAQNIRVSANNALVAGDVVAYCDQKDNNIILQYSLLDPNYSGPIEFKITAVLDSGPGKPTSYTMDFERPQIPVPVITTRGGVDFATNESTPTIAGTCIAERITGLQYRVDNAAWADLTCTNNTWSLTSAPLTGNPPTQYLFEFRSVNPHSKYQYSDIRSLRVLADTVPPVSAPFVAGVTSENENNIDEWLGGSYPTVHWARVADHEKVEIGVYGTDETTIVCDPILVANTEEIVFESEHCAQALVNDEYYKTRVRSQDAAGNFSVTPLWFQFKVDLTPPTLAFATVPANTTKANYATFTWTASAGVGAPLVSTAKCSLDGAAFTNCNSGITVNDLSVGNHNFRVMQSDVAGNSAQVTHAWTVDADILVPTCSITSPDIDWINTTTANFTFSCSDNDGIRDVKCRLQNATWLPCDSFTAHALTGLTSGEHFFQIQAQDHAGNLSAISVEQFRVDLAAPIIAWTLTPQTLVNQNSATFSFTVLDGASGVQSIECQLDAGGFSPCTSPYLISGPLADGAHTFTVQATDVAGNVATSPYTWTVDMTAPLAPIMGADGEAGRKPTWSWTSGGGGNGTYRFKLNDADMSSGTTETSALTHTPLFDLPFGSHTLYVQERDAAGNWSVSATQTFDAKCAAGEYLDGGNCQVCPLGTYQSLPSFNTSCSVTPIGSYNSAPGGINPTACPLHSTTLATGSTSLNDCLGDAGYYACEDGTCDPADADYYSAAASNLRSVCPTNSFTAGSGPGADSLADCLAGTDYFDDDSNDGTIPVLVGTGAYSPYRDNSKYLCTNLPSAATSVIYAGSGGGSNNCPIASVLTCDVGYIPNGTSCSDNSPGALVFTNINNADPNTLTESNALTVTGFDGPLTATCSDCTDIARNGAWGGTSVAGFMPGDTIAIRRNSALSFSTGVLSTVTLGVTTSSNWVISTRAAYTCNGGSLGTINHGASVTAFAQSNPLPSSSCASLSETRNCDDGTLSGTYTNATCAEGCAGTIWGDVASGFSSTAYSSALPAASCGSVSQTRTCTNGVMSGSFTNTTCTSGCTGTPWGNVISGYSNTAYSSATPASSCAAAAETRTCTNGTFSGSYSATSCSNGCTGTPWGNLTHGSTRTGYLYTSAQLPGGCASYATTRTCSNGTLAGNASYSNTACTTTCNASYGAYCGTGYYTGCDGGSSGPISESGAWCTFPGAPYYQTGSVCSSSFQNNGADGINGTGDDIYHASCYYAQPYNMYYNCNGDCM